MDAISHCPTCHQPLTTVGIFQICPLHGQVSQELQPHSPLRIFLSYGHDDNEELVRLIKTDLEKRGHDVWFDKNEIKFGDEWRRCITDGILGSNRVLSFLSKYSTRDPGVCRDEIAIAIGVKGGNIQTILVESELEVQPPVNIGHIQWLDMHEWQEKQNSSNEAWETWYKSKLAEIVRVVESDESRRFAGEIEKLNEYLKPIKSDARISGLLSKGFYGREWLFEAVENWRKDTKNDSRLFWIMGDPGVGKSAFAAQLTHKHGDTVIAAQFCDWTMTDHRDARRVVCSITFQLATRLPDYRKLLLTLPEIKELDSKDSSELFDYLLANPLKSSINGGRQRCLIVIDALDEAGESGRNPLVEMLARNAQHLPDWLGIVVTSRPEFDVKTPFQALNPFPIDTKSESNKSDIRDYLSSKLAVKLNELTNTDNTITHILEKSEGVFLYVERFCDDVLQGHLSLEQPDNFPQGLGGIFDQYFKRQFPDLDKFRKEIRPALRAILAAREPLPIEILQKLFNWLDEELRDFIRLLGSLFPVSKLNEIETIKPYHKSLADWLANDNTAGIYFVSVFEGKRILAEFCLKDYQHKNIKCSTYALKNLIFYLIDANQWEMMYQVIQDFEFVNSVSKQFGLTNFLDKLQISLSGYIYLQRVIRVFLESTFSDFKEERDMLNCNVFPLLSNWAKDRNCRFEAIDLKWGTTEETMLNHNILELGRSAISRYQNVPSLSKFIFLVGQKYGWGPLPSRIEFSEFESIIEVLSEDDIPFIYNWYNRDDNAVPAEYCLKLQNIDVREFTAWIPIEMELRKILNKAIDKIGWDNSDPRKYKYELSAVHQSFKVLKNIPKSEENSDVIGFFREIESLPKDLSSLNFFDHDKEGHPNEYASILLEGFKRELSEGFPNNIHSFVTTWTDTGLNTDYLKHFGESAFFLLCKLIDDDTQRFKITNSLKDEIRWHQEYTRLKTVEFAGREEFIHKIINYCDDQKKYPLIIHGESGSGKTALLAKIARILEIQNNVLITRYIGVTPASTESHSLIESITMQIATHYYLDVNSAPIEYLKNTGNILKILSLAQQTKPLILLIDGVDELDASGVEYFLNIVTQELPSTVKFVLSVDSKSHASKIFVQKLPSEHNIMLTPMPAIEAMSLLDEMLEHRSRRLRSDQFEEIIARFRCKGLPMYLSLAIDEVCNWHSFDLVKQLPDDVAGLLNNAFDRLEMQIGSMWIGKAISYIALSRFGLSESELFEILSNDEEIIHYYKDSRPDYMAINEIPRIVFLAIQSGLNPYLTNRRVHGVDVFTFSHKVIFETALQRYNICDRTMKRSAHHHLLAEYYCKHIIEKNADETLTPNVRALLEFVYHKAQY